MAKTDETYNQSRRSAGLLSLEPAANIQMRLRCDDCVFASEHCKVVASLHSIESPEDQYEIFSVPPGS